MSWTHYEQFIIPFHIHFVDCLVIPRSTSLEKLTVFQQGIMGSEKVLKGAFGQGLLNTPSLFPKLDFILNLYANEVQTNL